MIFLVHYLKNKREINSLRPHQPNTESLGFHKGNPMYLSDGTMVCPLDVIAQRFPLQERHRDRKTHFMSLSSLLERPDLDPVILIPKQGQSTVLPYVSVLWRQQQPNGQWSKSPCSSLSTCVTLSKSLTFSSTARALIIAQN